MFLGPAEKFNGVSAGLEGTAQSAIKVGGTRRLETLSVCTEFHGNPPGAAREQARAGGGAGGGGARGRNNKRGEGSHPPGGKMISQPPQKFQLRTAQQL